MLLFWSFFYFRLHFLFHISDGVFLLFTSNISFYIDIFVEQLLVRIVFMFCSFSKFFFFFESGSQRGYGFFCRILLIVLDRYSYHVSYTFFYFLFCKVSFWFQNQGCIHYYLYFRFLNGVYYIKISLVIKTKFLYFLKYEM